MPRGCKIIKKGFISVNFNIGVYKEGKRKGKTHDRGTNFMIKVEDIGLLFDEIII